MGKGDDRRKKDVRRRLAPAEEPGARRARSEQMMEVVGRELGDPARFPVHLRHLGQLSFSHPLLRELRLPPERFLPALIELRPPAEPDDPVARQRAYRVALAERSADPKELPVWNRLLEQAFLEVERMDDLLAIGAGRALLMACADKGGWDHPWWALLVELSFSEAWMSGAVLSALGLEASRTSAAEVGPPLARALAQTELSQELAALAVEEETDELCRAVVAQVHADDPVLRPFELEFDAVLHLVACHAGIAANLAERLAREGLTDEVRAEILRHWEDSYRDDITGELVGEVLAWTRAHLERLRDAPEAAFGEALEPERLRQERLRAAGLYVGLRLFGPGESKLLRAMHLRGLHRAPRLASEHELPSVQKLWSNPLDTHGLEEYEQILRDLGQPNRAGRVARYRASLRRARKVADAGGGAG